ncbi:hypothetical protein QBC33DRAFT_564509 [Phialemonium atrogriseum]|uniref:Uncharacterized protein n=1 Tax=Phialemonium atrogriseum TaxID=1093897 RepID=A0AAJ0BQT2_9PEZI|nr:uncharacterized protein QBC33DRAFT_564509 [Phialemonium atrogriseum]KAK1761703.1 hypothetical protein QBC33DRAFT_564509 [Phialemonium atrogriseum]
MSMNNVAHEQPRYEQGYSLMWREQSPRTENDGAGHRLPPGADVVKFFADYRCRIMRLPPAQQHPYVPRVLHLPRGPNPDYMVFSREEMDVMVGTAGLA